MSSTSVLQSPTHSHSASSESPIQPNSPDLNEPLSADPLKHCAYSSLQNGGINGLSGPLSYHGSRPPYLLRAPTPSQCFQVPFIHHKTMVLLSHLVPTVSPHYHYGSKLALYWNLFTHFWLLTDRWLRLFCTDKCNWTSTSDHTSTREAAVLNSDHCRQVPLYHLWLGTVTTPPHFLYGN